MYLDSYFFVMSRCEKTFNEEFLKNKESILTFFKYPKMLKLLQTTNQERNVSRFVFFCCAASCGKTFNQEFLKNKESIFEFF
jgi:hypothetical protein